jgi:hypothetical protein
MILNKSQAEAVYSAMCVLNNVNGKIDVYIDGCIQVIECSRNRILVTKAREAHEERYENQNAFREAYGIPE